MAATLAPLRSLDPEIVLAVDDRVDPDWVEGYRQIADRVFVVPFPGVFSQLYAWLREQCGGRWIFQLDADEVPAPGVAREVAETIEAGDVTHCWVPRRWLYPDRSRWLAQWPWRPDYALRLLRNDPAVLRFPAIFHGTIEALGERRFLREPIYHAAVLLSDVATRERRCADYEAERPGLVIDGQSLNEVYYLPERGIDLRTLPVPDSDAGAVAAFIDAEALPSAGPADARAVLASATVEEITLRSEHRSPDARDYVARLTLLDDDLRLLVDEWRTFDFEVENLGGAHWPGGMVAHPQIRLAYRWVGEDGDRRDGMRTGLGAPLAPGGRAIVPLEVLGPAVPGTHEIEIDLVHEDVRWFGCGVRARLDVRAPARGCVPRQRSI